MMKKYFSATNITWLPGILFMIIVLSNLVISSNFKVTEPPSWLIYVVWTAYFVPAISALILGIYQIHTKKTLPGIMNTVLGISFFYTYFSFSVLGFVANFF